MERTLSELAALVGGRVRGDGSVRIRGAAPIEEAEEGDITFVANPKYTSKARTTRASAIVVAPGFEEVGKPLLEVENPYAAFARVIEAVMPMRTHPARGVAEGAFVHPTARLGRDVAIAPTAFVDAHASIGDRTVIYPQVFIGRGVVIGEDCVLYPGVKVYDGSCIGKRVTVQANTVIGSDGFGFAPEGEHYVRIPQVGSTVIEDDVDIGSNVTINRGTLGQTRIGQGTKIDSNVVVAHNVVIGPDSILVAQVGISGSVRIGRHCTLAGQVGVAGHLEIGDNVTVAAKAGVTNSLAPNRTYLGQPAMPAEHARRCYVVFSRLPELAREVKDLRRRLQALEAEGKGDG